MNKILWEIMEMEAVEKFFVNGKEHPLFLYFPKGHYLAMEERHTLYMNGVGLISTFSSKKKAFARLKEIVENANFPVRVSQVSQYGRNKGKRFVFAENKTQRVPLEPERVVEGAFVKVFNINEWQEEV